MSIDFGGIVSTRSLSFPPFEFLRHDQGAGGWSWSFSSSLLNLTQVALSLLTLAM